MRWNLDGWIEMGRKMARRGLQGSPRVTVVDPSASGSLTALEHHDM
jgi:hypothetical protein